MLLRKATIFFVSLDLVRSDVDLGVSGLDDTDTTFGLGLGLVLNENFTVQAGYQDFGEISVSGNGSAKIEADAFQVSITGGVPAGENISLYAEAGIDFWDASVSYVGVPGFGTGSASDDGQDIFFGIGAAAKASDNLAIKLEYQLHELDDVDIDILSLGIAVLFQ